MAELSLEDPGARVLIPTPELSLVCSLGNGPESNIASGVELASEAVRLIFFFLVQALRWFWMNVVIV